MKYSEATEGTIIFMMPTNSKQGTYGEVRNHIRNIVGTLYEDEEARSEYGSDNNPSNCIIYCKKFNVDESKAIRAAIEAAGMVPIIITGKTASFENVDEDTIDLDKTYANNED